MGGLPCRKELIDQRNALLRALDCMCESVRIYVTEDDTTLLTYADVESFHKAAEPLAKEAARIEKKVSGGG